MDRSGQSIQNSIRQANHDSDDVILTTPVRPSDQVAIDVMELGESVPDSSDVKPESTDGDVDGDDGEPAVAANPPTADDELVNFGSKEDGFDQPGHRHYSHRSPWLRAAVLGANDGLVSVASIMMGVTAGNWGDPSSRHMSQLAGVAGLVAGALSMALGEFVSVYSQKDAEAADIQRERMEFMKSPEAREQEEKELALIYQSRGLSASLAKQVARELHNRHLDEVVKIHARDELGIDTDELSNPLQAMFMSACTFAAGAAMPLLAGAFIVPDRWRIIAIVVVASFGLALFGGLGALLGGAPIPRAALRVLLGGWIAMAGTFGIGRAFGGTIA